MSLSFTYQWWIGDAVGEAVQNSIRAGVSYVVAAGNNYGADACERTPARVPDAITVGATTSSEATNAEPKPFVWTKTADEIFASIRRFCERTSDSGH